MAAVQFSDFISICRDGVEYRAFVGDLPFDGGGSNDIDDFVEKRGDTMTGPLLLYATTPSESLEAASKAYVDLQVLANKAQDGGLNFLDPSGSTVVTFSANQKLDQDVSVFMKDSYIPNLPTLS